jgi:L-threonylcarbamoyladenylate synthase
VSSIAETVGALEAGDLVILPTDTVYGLACRPDREDAVRALSAAKGRSPSQPIALVAASADALVELIPELRSARFVKGPFTLVVGNPARRLRWLTGDNPDTIGVRLPSVEGVAADLLEQVGVVAATSANVHGGEDPRRLDDVPTEILGAVSATLDGGELPGVPSTVVDLTGAAPRVLREGAIPAAEALALIARALAE